MEGSKVSFQTLLPRLSLGSAGCGCARGSGYGGVEWMTVIQSV